VLHKISIINPAQGFYAAHGWEPFNSAHISLSATSKTNGNLQYNNILDARPLYASDIPELCAIDEQQVRRTMLKASSSGESFVAIVPDSATIRWHHAREEFVGQELHGKAPEIKGAIVGTEPGKRVWCYWTRMFYNEEPNSCEENTLHILRLVVEGQGIFSWEKDSQSVDMSKYVPAITALFKMAQKEAVEWNMADVQIWNPTDATIEAVRVIQPDAKVVNRDQESIASLMWYGDRRGEGSVAEYVHWLGNEKYGWC
jgi:hypothetical protein